MERATYLGELAPVGARLGGRYRCSVGRFALAEHCHPPHPHRDRTTRSVSSRPRYLHRRQAGAALRPAPRDRYSQPQPGHTRSLGRRLVHILWTSRYGPTGIKIHIGGSLINRRIRISAVCVLFALFAASVPYASPALAFPQSRGNCDWGESITWYFSTGSWTTSQKASVRDGLDDWLTVKSYDGTRVVSSITETGSGDIPVKKVVGLPGAGGTDCTVAGPAPVLTLDADLTNTQFKDIGAHEMGHHLEMYRRGRYDHCGGLESYMGICRTTVNKALSQDDYGHVEHHWGPLYPYSIHANVGFEHGTTWWWKSNVSDFYTSGSSPRHGSNALRWRPTADNGYVYQTMNFVNSGGEEIDARMSYRKISSSTTTGDMKMEILRRRVDYGLASSGDCEYNQFQAGANDDQNVRDVVYNFVRKRRETVTPTTTWQGRTEGTNYTMPVWEGADIRFRVKSTVKYTDQTFALLTIDTARARHD